MRLNRAGGALADAELLLPRRRRACEREEGDEVERRRGGGRWQVGPGEKELTYRFASSDGPRGRGKKSTWAVEKKEKGPSTLRVFSI